MSVLLVSLGPHVVNPMLPSEERWLQAPSRALDAIWVIQKRLSGVILHLSAVPAQSFAFQGKGGARLVLSPAPEPG